MTRHLIRLMWNRKQQNVLLLLEVFAAFLVVVGVAVTSVHFGYNALQPLGFSVDDVWALEVNRGGRDDTPEALDAARGTLRHIEAELAGLPGIERISGAFTGPYRWYSWGTTLDLEGRPPMQVSTNRTDDAFSGVLGIDVLSGRWFSREDDGSAWEPVVMNRRLAVDIFGREDVVGMVIPESGPRDPESSSRGDRPKRVVGVIDDFRQFGELSTPVPVLFYRATLGAPIERFEFPEALLLKVRPGTTAAFEEVLLSHLHQLAPTWSFGIQPVAALRESMLREGMIPLVVVALIAAAMLLMVALGLTGVVWQTVTQRMREFGLRRAQGATGADVGRQVILELVVLTSFAVVAGCLLLLQIPLLPLPPDMAVVSRPVFVAGVLVAVVAVYSVTILCAWYPSRLATRVPPAEALRYE